MSSSIQRILFLAVLAAVFGAAGVLAGPVETYGMVFVLDGAKGDVFLDYALNGYRGRDILPNLRKYFIDEGVWVKETTGVFPTITGAGMPAVLTGCYPGRHNLPSLYFFDRKSKQYPVLYVPIEALDWNSWLSPKVKTIWEHFPGPDDSISFGPALSRGSDSHVPIVWNLKYRPMELRAQLQVGWRQAKRFAAGGLPARLTVVYNGWFDHMEHGKGARSESLIEDYIHVDRQVGEAMQSFLEMVKAREKAGATVRHYASLVSDHGHQDVKKVISIDDFIRNQKGARVLDKIWRRLFGVKLKGDVPKDFSSYDLVCASGEGHALLYFPTPKGKDGAQKDWDHAPPLELLRKYPYKGQTIDIVATSVDADAISFAVGKNKATGVVHVWSRLGETTIERRQEPSGTFYRYRIVTGRDPLGFAEYEKTKEMVGDQYWSSREWQLATLATEYPDAPVMLYQVFDSERSADLFLSAAPFVSIGDLVDGDKSKSKHGGLTKDEAWSTMAFHGTGIRGGSMVATGRNVDMVPTMLSLMDYDYDPAGVDGEAVPEVLDQVNEWKAKGLKPGRAVALRLAAAQIVRELATTPEDRLTARAAALQALLARPGLPAAEVRSFRAKAHAALANRRSPRAQALIRGEVAIEFLSRRRADLAAAATASGSLPAADAGVVEVFSRDFAEAGYRRVFDELQVAFDSKTDKDSAAGKALLARVDAEFAALVALHNSGAPVQAPKVSFDTQRNGINLWLEGLESGPASSDASSKALSEFVRIERARATGTIRGVFFDKNRASLQVAVGERLQKLVSALAAKPSGKPADVTGLASRLPVGRSAEILSGLATYGKISGLPGTHGGSDGAAAGRVLRGEGASQLDGLYRDMGAR